jgi:Tannase-like family of unknown function (DUF6351)
MRGRTRRWMLAGACLLGLFATAAPAAAQNGALTIATVSNTQPQLVSGGQVLVRVTAPSSSLRSKVKIKLNGDNVSSAFQPETATTLLGLVDGLRQGGNELVAKVKVRRHHHARTVTSKLALDDHPISGPVFSGPQQTPFYCETQTFGLAAAQSPKCYAPKTVTYMYRTTAGAFQPVPGNDPTQKPQDLATTKVNGKTVPYIVRLEQGVIDRGVYQIAALWDGTDPSPFTPDASWNRKLVYTFGGGCNAGYHQGRGTGGVLQDLFLSKGYAVASNTLNVLDNNCSPIISAEAAMMTKEHFIETYGPVLFTMGSGLSGGGIQQYDIAESYPGILDGIVPGISFPDPITTGGPVTDCRLLINYNAGPGAGLLTSAQLTAVAGFNSFSTCTAWNLSFASRATATDSCDSSIPLAVQWNPTTNPNGVKCQSTEQIVNQLGRDPKTGFVRTALDNIGLQYGLTALEAGEITPAQFVALNANIGGLNVQGASQAARTPADPKALDALYRDDIVNSASLGLASTPIIDERYDLDLLPPINSIHTTDWSYVMRARLHEANGSAANQVIIESQPNPAEVAASDQYVVDGMDRWLMAIRNDHSHRTPRAKVIDDRPADVSDGCYLSATQLVHEQLTDPASGQCAATYPVAGNTRLSAGQPLSMMAIKCQLTPLNFASYPNITFTPDEQTQLKAAFSGGVCDWSKPGVEQQKPIGVWLSYGDETTGLTRPTQIGTARR